MTEEKKLAQMLIESAARTSQLAQEILRIEDAEATGLAVQGESQIVRDGNVVTLEWSETLPDTLDWHAASKVASEYGDGWRLPSIEELESIVDLNRCLPACSIPSERGLYWSASPDAYSSSYAWNVSFSYGGEGNLNKDLNLHVRLVRDKL